MPISPAQEAIYRAVVELGEQSHEGAAQINANRDGQGLSYGGIQSTQKSGTLGKLLGRARTSFPGPFEQAFGPAWAELLDVTGAASLAPVAGAVLWQSPWTERFAAAGRTLWMKGVQVNHAFSKDAGFWPATVDACRQLRLTTVRSHAMVMDRTVNGGTGRTRGALAKTLAYDGLWTLDENGRLGIFAHFALGDVEGGRFEDAMRDRWLRVYGAPYLTDDPLDLAVA